MKCITLTLNPAFDRHCYVPNFEACREHLATNIRCEAGGKGVNISRALWANGVENLAFVVLGEQNREQFLSLLRADGIVPRSLTLGGSIRENLTIHTDGGAETRVSFEGFSADDSLLCEVLEQIRELVGKDTYLTFTGRAPAGVSMTAINDFLAKIRSLGARVVIDSRSFRTLDEITAASPWLIKPNAEEIAEYLGVKNASDADMLRAARKIHADGVDNVMISNGARGALLVCREGAFVATPPDVSVKSTIGAGDSAIGGFLAASMQNKNASEALRHAVAYGTAACMQEGTGAPRKEDIARVAEQIKIQKI